MVCSKWEIYKNNYFPYFEGHQDLGHLLWVSMVFSMYPSLSLCLCDRGTETLSMVMWAIRWAWNPISWGNCVCILSWTFWNSWECLRKKWDWLQGRILESFVSFWDVDFFLRCYFYLLQTSIRDLRWLAIKDSQVYTYININPYTIYVYICICIISNQQWGWL